MNILILGAAGFIGTNLTIKLAAEKNNKITLVDKSWEYFRDIESFSFENVTIKESGFEMNTDFETLLINQDVVYHLVSTTVPTTSNQHIPQELVANVVVTSMLLEACVKCGVKKVVFISSGGTVYGKSEKSPLKENAAMNPISSYGIQKITIENLLYLYQYIYGLDYRVIRLANPYGPYQRPNGILGVITTFAYKALKEEELIVYGDGSVIRDFIYIDDAIRAILMITNGENEKRTFNLGCGYGISIKETLNIIRDVLDVKLNVTYASGRKVDVPVNYLDISRYEKAYGDLNPIALGEGIKKTAEFMKEYYKI
ncbi:MAG: epimerase [Firmicutes bacterium HGW-Firmicutes-4]|nr:MAG: epimerase [Firmicutes bacterium HGW-Firmicutes-4]